MTPIFELSFKLFPSSDVRGCENLPNQALRSGDIAGSDQEAEAEDERKWVAALCILARG